MKEYACKDDMLKIFEDNFRVDNVYVYPVYRDLKELPTVTESDIRIKIIDEILKICGDGIYNCDCDLCPFAIFEDDIVRVGCEISRLKEQDK